MVKKIPMRRCLGCMESKPKKELIRIVRLEDKNIVLDKTGRQNGRGAYFCNNKECLQKLIKSGRLAKEFDMQISKEDFDKIISEFEMLS